MTTNTIYMDELYKIVIYSSLKKFYKYGKKKQLNLKKSHPTAYAYMRTTERTLQKV